MAETLTVEDKKVIQKMIDEQSSNKKLYKFNLLFKGTRDGLTSATFHQLCDTKGPTLTVVVNTAKCVFGAYTTVPWQSFADGMYFPDCCAFLFRLRQEGVDTFTPMKYPVKKSDLKAVYCHTEHGPTFGAGHDLLLFSGSPTKTDTVLASGSSTMTSYIDQGNTGREFNGNFDIEEIEVYVVEETGLLKDTRMWCDDLTDWSDKSRAILMKDVIDYIPYGSTELKVKQVNILMVGPIGAGKSSYYNTINSAYKRRLTSRAAAGRAQESLTNTFHGYGIQIANSSGDPLGFKLCDTMGLEESRGIDKSDLSLILDGYVQDGYKFSLSESISKDDPRVSETATFASKMHCVAFVIDSTKVDILPQSIIQRLSDFKKAAFSRRLTVVVLLTKIDQVCPYVMEDLTNVFRSETMLGVVESIADKLGIPKYCVLPVKNYESERRVSDAVDILALASLRQILNFTDDFLEGELDKKR